MSLGANEASRRSFPRIRLNKPARVGLANGGMPVQDAYDISPGGLQLRCNREISALIHPTQTVIKAGNYPKIVVTLGFPYPAGLPEVVAECCIRFVKVVGQDEFLFGMSFEQFRKDGATHFARFIEASLSLDSAD